MPPTAVLSWIQPTLPWVSVGNQKFYKMQVIETCGKKKEFSLVQNWGRIGTEGQAKVSSYKDAASAVEELEKVFKKKSGLAFADRNSGAAVGGTQLFLSFFLAPHAPLPTHQRTPPPLVRGPCSRDTPFPHARSTSTSTSNGRWHGIARCSAGWGPTDPVRCYF